MSVSLEPLTLSDHEEVYDLFTNALVLKSYPEPPISNRDGTSDFIQRITHNGVWSWKILTEEERIFMGVCSLHHFDEENKTIEIGGTLRPEYWGKGIMTRAFDLLIEKAQHQFNINQVLGKTRSSNSRALSMVQKMGFQILSTTGEEILLIKHLNLEG